MKNCLRTGKNLSAVIFALLLSAASLQAQLQHTSAEYLLVEQVERLLIYNKYQQHITSEERKLITPFVPIKVIDASAKLNDDFTPCLKVEIQGTVFYILKNDMLENSGKRKTGFMHIFKNAIVLNDTIRLASSKTIFSSPDQTIHHPLQTGKFLERYFRDEKKTFVKLIGRRTEYGWVNFADKNNTKEYALVSSKASADSELLLPDAIQRRIQSKLAEANKALNNLFTYFNTETNAKNATPQWRFIAEEQQYTCVLEPEEYAEHYAESTRYLSGEIDNILLGTNYGSAASPGKIDIRLK